MTVNDYILLAVLFIGAVGAVGIVVRMTVTHRRNMRELDARHAEWQRGIDDGYAGMETAIKLARQRAMGMFDPGGRIVRVGPGYFVTEGMDGKQITTITD